MKKFWQILKILFGATIGIYIAALAIVIAFANYHRPVGKADAIIVLGAAINTPAAYNRALEGLRLYEAGDAPEIVLSGGQDYAGSETEAVYMQATILHNAKNVPSMILDPDSRSTYDNIENSKKLLPKARSVIIVSDSFHLARGVVMAESAGFSPVYWSSPQPTYYRSSELAYYYLREALALIDYVPKFILGK